MVLSIFFTVTGLMLIAFVVTERKLHLFEIIFIWTVAWLVLHTASSIIIVNLKGFAVSERFDLFIVHLCKRLILYPLIITWCMELSLLINHKLFKVIFFIGMIFFMTLLEYTFMNVGVLIPKHWAVWKSLIEWGITFSITVLGWQYYRRVLFKTRG